ncbi:MAG: YifB family Mg chelatase-like AAA ATPase [Aliarcobacter sp.]|uniref:Magnesium chelatase-related protein n=1 Tax=Arcobacter aquimarinus TaxID=1315211 RepID=A0AAE7B2X4_9BACT|nr:YifB family Mg chelatase-like AAA ATPase [Arcobacter aquimarinus]MCB9096754.1 YifB family Mg chelatase-like AAA ATPase [Arcobacter sp.]QKE26593.1 magnesium chelatase-related protein [Arcobacter aquimarinus]RXI31362.1 Fis family transcriptional regulator [Arcobacter aquimarinus]
MKIIKSASLDSIEAIAIDVESTFTKGLPTFTIVGMISTSISESKDRVKSALLTNGFKFPPLKITVNLSPSEIAKKGTHFDLAIALQIAFYDDKKVNFSDIFVFGELALDGNIKDTNSIFPIILSLSKKDSINKVLVSSQTAQKLANIPNLKIYCVNNLSEAIEFIKTDKKENYLYEKKKLEYKTLIINDEQYFYDTNYLEDFKDVIGQDMAKYAAMICAAGNHNLIMEGSPGCGKSMISKRLQYIMPPMNLEEILEKAKLLALDFKEVDFSPIRAFRSPHHSSTKSSIFGGGSSNAKMGEIALSNGGILFFDELPHFSKSILEALREPLEDNKILISRVNNKILYETKFIFVAAMNPCPCGNLLSSVKECRCNEIEIQRYKNRLSEPFLDRVDLYLVMNDSFKDNKNKVSSKELHENIIKAFIKQKQRGQKELNGKLSDEEIKKYCILDEESLNILEKARFNYQLSFRSINKVLKVARTIADLNDNEIITKNDLLQSLNFRRR